MNSLSFPYEWTFCYPLANFHCGKTGFYFLVAYKVNVFQISEYSMLFKSANISLLDHFSILIAPETASGGVPLKKLFLKTSQYSQENTCVEVFHKGFPVNVAKLKKKLILNVCKLLLLLPQNIDLNALIHFMPLFSFYTPWKYQITSGLLMFSGSIEKDQWREMG